MFGFDDVEDAIGARSGLAATARRQIAAALTTSPQGRTAMVRLGASAVSLKISEVRLPEGERAVVLTAPDARRSQNGADDVATRAIGGFSQPGHFLAIVDHEAGIVAATPGYETLGLSHETLAGLIATVRTESDRLVKRQVRGERGSYPAGMARLADSPARHLLVVVDEPAERADKPGVAVPREIETTAATAEPPASTIARASADKTEQAKRVQADSSSQAWKRPIAAATPEQREQPRQAQSSEAREASAVRFLWRTDPEGRFNAISEEFLKAVGLPSDAIIGRLFRDVSAEFGLDADSEIASLLERRDTWSGRTVQWPVAGSLIPVDLAALPAYSRNRDFEGFRGFGILRLGDAALGTAPAPAVQPPVEVEDEFVDAPFDEADWADATPAADPDPYRGEVPALRIVPPSPAPEPDPDEKVVRLAQRRQPGADKSLSPIESSAFREIGKRLREEGGARPFGRRQSDRPAANDVDEPGSSGRIAGLPDSAITRYGPGGSVTVGGQTPIPTSDDSHQSPLTPTDDLGEEASGLPEKDGYGQRDDAPPATGQPGTYTSSPDIEEDDFQLDPAAPAPPAYRGRHDEIFYQGASATDHRAEREVIDRLPVPVLIHAGDTLLYANPEFLDLTGYPSLAALEVAGGLGALFSSRYEDDEKGEQQLHLRTRDGDRFPIDALLRSVPWQGGKALMLVVRRTGELEREAEAPALAEAKSRIAEMRAIIDTATDGVVLIDKQGLIRSISRPAEALFGFDSEDLEGKPFTSLFAIESQRAAKDYLAGLSDNGVASVLNDGREVIGREAQGRFVPLFMTIGRLPQDSGFCAVLRDVTQWKRAEEELSQSRMLAEKASSQKSDFLARVSHEIRTPLNAIIGFSELMLDEKFGPIGSDRYRDYLRDINRSGNHVLDLVNDLLDISKIEAGEQEMAYEAVSLNEALSDAVAIMQPQANRERVIIRSSFATRLPDVVADLRSIKQIALNVLSNAVRFTQAGGQVIISTAYEPNGDIAIRVRDTGIGMSPSEIEQALKPFKQINALKGPRGDGTGLGLPLTKAMVEANRANFAITSSPGQGTLVEILFPSTRVLAQ